MPPAADGKCLNRGVACGNRRVPAASIGTHCLPPDGVANERGESLVALHPVSAAAPGTPAFALVIACDGEGTVLVHNRRRQVWELPGGWIDPGESAAQCALRELLEESAVRADGVRMLAWIELAVPTAGGPRPDVICGALFAADTAAQERFEPGDEICGVIRCQGHALPAATSAIDAWLVRRFHGVCC